MKFTCPPPEDFPALMLALSDSMLRVVITGSPGCGKSALLAALANAGLPVWSADSAVAALYEPGRDGWHCLRGRYGDRFIHEDNGPVNRRALLSAMQDNPRLRREVEDMIHPLVRHDMEAFFAKQASLGATAAIAEVPLFLEAGWRSGDGSCDLLVGVACCEDERMRRLTGPRGWTPETVASMSAWQWPDADKMQACDLIVPNEGSHEELQQQAHVLMQRLDALRVQRREALSARLENLWKELGHRHDVPAA